MSENKDQELLKLINVLKKIDEDSTIDLSIRQVRNMHPLVKEAINLADDCLTDEDNYYNIQYVKEAGFDVYAGEQDRFGWLTGCIELQRGVIIFG